MSDATFMFHPPALNSPQQQAQLRAQHQLYDGRPSSSSAGSRPPSSSAVSGFPSLSAPLSYGGADEREAELEEMRPRSGYAGGQRPGTSGGAQEGSPEGKSRAGEQLSDGQTPSPTYPPPSVPGMSTGPAYQHPPFPMAPYPNHGVNMRNTRPMTAPSSVSAPYFGGSAYYQAGPSSFYAPPSFAHYHHLHPSAAPMLNAVPQRTHPDERSFQYHVDSNAAAAHEDAAYRGRNFSLPDLVGIDPSRSDARRYSQEEVSPASSSPGGQFMYGAPPRSPPSQVSPHALFSHQPSSPENGYDHAPHRRPSLPSTYGHPGTTAPHALHGPSPIYPYQPITVPASLEAPGTPRTAQDDAAQRSYNFIAQPGQQTKRPRRRFDEIERLYNCDYPGCQKAYGTLNHLNSHKTMQKHGPRSTPAEFKERRAAWRAGKKAAAAAAAAEKKASRSASSSSSTTPTAHPHDSPRRGSGPAERQRPSTSAGEYHFSLPTPAPFMSSIGTPVLPPGYPSMPLTTAEPERWGTSYGVSENGYTSSSHPLHHPLHQQQHHTQHRPVTAPSYYTAQPPAFGYPILAPGAAVGLTYSTGAGPGGKTIVEGGGGGRRMSLPHQPGGIFGFNAGGGSSAEEFPNTISEEGGYDAGEER